MSDGGFFLLHRGWRDNPVFRGEFSRSDAWVWLLENACWKPTRFDIRGKTVTLERGQLCGTLRQFADVWGWSKSAVERFIARLEAEQMVTLKPGQSKSILTICNYAKYQDKGEADRDKVGTDLGQSWDLKEQGNKGTSYEEEAKASPSPRAKRVRAVRIDALWVPSPLPANVASLVAQWPPGREVRELDGFRDYWLARERDAARSDWDKVWHNRIRDIHDRVLKDNRYGPGRDQQHLDPSGRSIGRTEAAARAVAARIQSARSPAPAPSGRSECLPLALPNPMRSEWDEHGRPDRMAGGRS